MTTIASETAPQRSGLAHPEAQPITAQLSAAGSVRRELEDLLAAAPDDADRQTFRTLVTERNVTGKRSAAGRVQTWKNLRARYVLDPSVPEFRMFRQHMASSGNREERGLLCLLMMSRTDRLFREATINHISPNLAGDRSDIPTDEVESELARLTSAYGTTWTESTLVTIRQHLLSALKDFAVLQGRRNKRTVAVNPTPAVIIFAAQLGKLECLTDRQVLDARWYRLLGLSHAAVVERLYAAAQRGAIQFRMQAEVVELKLPGLEAES